MPSPIFRVQRVFPVNRLARYAIAHPDAAIVKARRLGSVQWRSASQEPIEPRTSVSLITSSPATQPRTPPPSQTIHGKRSIRRAKRLLDRKSVRVGKECRTRWSPYDERKK